MRFMAVAGAVIVAIRAGYNFQRGWTGDGVLMAAIALGLLVWAWRSRR